MTPSPSVLSIFFFLLVSFFSSRILCHSIEVESHHHHHHQKHHKHHKHNNNNALFVFGDSYFDPGNNNYINTSTLDQSNFPPYGQTYFGFPTGRFSDGRLIPDFICEYAKLPLIGPYMEPEMSREKYIIHGANFASAGAGALLETFQGSVISLQTQIRYHKRVENRLRKIYGKTEARKILSKAVYLFSIGTNDYISPYLITNSTHFNSTNSDQLIKIVIGNITAAITELHKRGGRKFGFLNLGPLGCIPGLRIILNPPNDSGGCIKAASLLANLHNQAFSKALKGLAKHLHGFKYSLYNANSFLQHRLKHPSKYGYKQGKTACCGTGRFRGTYSCGGKRPPVKEFKVCENPKDYLFWDSYHLTERAYKEMASQMWSQKANTGTYNLKTLFQLQ